MLKRTISSVVISLLFILALALNSLSAYITVAFFALLSGIATYEMLHSTKCVKDKKIALLAALFSAVTLFVLAFYSGYVFIVSVFYAFSVALLALIKHKEVDIKFVAALFAFPIILPYGFMSIYTAFAAYGGRAIMLIINFACINDVFAYLVGVTCGKHKLCPTISPKKTIEGAVGGILAAMIMTAVIILVFCKNPISDLILFEIITPFMCVIGIVGDLFASVIKRSAGIKDYGNLIPGHGGIMDRFDSILLIAPVFLALLRIFVK